MASTSRPSLTFLGIAGSLRNASYNRGLTRAAMEVAPAGTSVVPYDLAEIPMFNADVEADGEPPAVAEFKRAIAGADGLLIAPLNTTTAFPECSRTRSTGPAARAPAVLSEKPVGIMGASTGRGATARAQAHLRDGLAYTNGLVLPLPEVLVASRVTSSTSRMGSPPALCRSWLVIGLKASGCH